MSEELSPVELGKDGSRKTELLSAMAVGLCELYSKRLAEATETEPTSASQQASNLILSSQRRPSIYFAK